MVSAAGNERTLNKKNLYPFNFGLISPNYKIINPRPGPAERDQNFDKRSLPHGSHH